MDILNKLNKRASEFKKHPLTDKNIFRAIGAYLCFNIYSFFKEEIKYNWVGELKFIARKGDAGIVANIYFGLYEFKESAFLLHFLRKEDIFLDVGANLGHYSLLASGITRSHSIAVEPVPQSLAQLAKQIELNHLDKKITIHNLGVSDEASKLYFSTDRGTMNRVVDENYGNSVKIPVSTIDEIASGLAINLMKIDVEGFEKKVLLGGSRTLQNKSLKAIIIEINHNTQKYGVKAKEIVDLLMIKGFHPYDYNPENRQLIKLNSYNHMQFNTIFVRDFEYVQQRIVHSNPFIVRNKKF